MIRGFSLKIRYKISESFKFNEIYTQSKVRCAESDVVIFKFVDQSVVELLHEMYDPLR